MNKKTEHLTRAGLAERWGTSPQAVGQLLKRHSIRPNADGRFNPTEVEGIVWGNQPHPGAGPTMAETLLRKENLICELKAMELGRQQGRYIDVAVVERTMGFCYGNVRNRLLALPSRLAPRICGVTSVQRLHAILASEIRQVLEELVKIGGTMPPDEPA